MKSKKILLAAIIVSFLAVMPVSAQLGTPTQLTFNPLWDEHPSISGDGSKIAFMSLVDGDWEIYMINSDGTGLTQLTSNSAYDGKPSISGDGSKIAFMSTVDGDLNIFVINSDGTGLTQLTSTSAFDRYPSISDDGSKIAFASYVSDNEIYVINSDGTGLTQLTSNSMSDDRWPSISGDGSKIAFTSNRDWDDEIYAINSDGTGLTQLTFNSIDDSWPSISGDGSKIAFHSYEDDLEIYVINSDGSGLTQLTSNSIDDRYPSISGDGSKIAFTSIVGYDETYLSAINSDGSGLTQLTSITLDIFWPSISGDGSKIAFGSDESEIYVVSYTANQPLVADAGPDKTVEQTYYQGANVMLDGSGSYDPDGDPLTYSWTWPGGSATGMNPTVPLPLGTTIITLVVNDGNVDSDSDTVVVTVQDTTAPEITCPAEVTVEQESEAGTEVPLMATATDICDADPTITSDEQAIYPLGTTTVTFTATDDTGNTASCTTTVTVIDTTAPEITPSDEQIVLWPPNHKYHTVEIPDCVISVTDICDADADIDNIVITSVSSDELEDAQGKGDGNTEDDIVIVDSQTVELRAERQGGGNGRVYTIDFKVTDASGNTETGSCAVWVLNDQESGDTAVDDGADVGYTVDYP